MNFKKLIALSALLLTTGATIQIPAQAQYYGAYGSTFNNPMSASANRIIASRMERRRLQRRLARKRAAKKTTSRKRMAKKSYRAAR